MDLEKKSFEEPDPNLNFLNSKDEQLDIASRKNELSLSLIPTTPFKNLFALDDTPTPTRYLNGFETDMFPELHSDNPFDATFRKANSSRDPNTFSIPESSSLIASLPESEDLNTPSITLPSETPIILRKTFSKPSTKPTTITLRQDSESTDTMPFTPATESTSVEEVVQFEQSARVNVNQEISTAEITSFISSATSVLESAPKIVSPKTNVVQTPVITSTGNFSIAKSNSAVPTAVVVNGSKNIIRNLASVPSIVTPSVIVSEKPPEIKIEPPQAVVQSVCVTPMVQLMIRLPDGQTMPVNLPMMPQPAPTVPVQKTILQVPTAEPEVSPSTVAKMKLKEALKMNQKSSVKVVPSVVKGKVRPMIQSVPQEVLLPEFVDSPPSSPIPIQKANGRKRSHSFDTSPDEKQKRSRERNRAAATRCREKRKLWITGLERKAEELETKNSHLQVEVDQLRNEVAQLKTMLLAHKDCPVTLQQKGMAYESPKNSYIIPNTIRVMPSTSEDLQRVPNCSISSPVNPSEFIEVEIGSVQSSDASLTSSDASETSFKER